MKETHVSVPLTNFALRFKQDQKNFIADMIVPEIKVTKQADKFFTFDRGNYRGDDDLRHPGSEARQALTARLSTNAYFSNKHSLMDIVSIEEVEDADKPLDPKQDTVSDLTDKLMINREVECAALVFATASVQNYTSLATASQWGYTSTTTPIDDVETGRVAVAKEIGFEPNAAACGREVYQVLRNHEDILDRIKYSEKGILTEDLIASVMDLDKLLVGRAVNLTTNEGIASETSAYIWGKNLTIAYVNARPSKKAISFAYNFAKKTGMRVKDFWLEKNEGWQIEATTWYDYESISKYAGYTIFGAVA